MSESVLFRKKLRREKYFPDYYISRNNTDLEEIAERIFPLEGKKVIVELYNSLAKSWEPVYYGVMKNGYIGNVYIPRYIKNFLKKYTRKYSKVRIKPIEDMISLQEERNKELF